MDPFQGLSDVSRKRVSRCCSWVLLSVERKQVGAIVLQQFIGNFGVLRREFFAKKNALVFCPIRTPNRGKFGPKEGTNWINGRASAFFVRVGQAQLRGWMPFGGGAKVKIKPTGKVLFNAKAKRVDVPKQKLGLCIACIGGWNQVFNGLFKLSIDKRVPRDLHIGLCGQGKAKQKKKSAHWLSLWFGVCFAGFAGAQELPKPLSDDAFLQFDPAQARLGQMLFYDPILSGNRNISCATCHSGAFGSGDGVALSFGEGGIGLGPARIQGTAKVRQSRNAPPLWNLSAIEVRALFHDGRVEVVNGTYQTPAGGRLPDGLTSLLAVQALFPLIARTEMAGDPEENDIALAAFDNAPKAWRLIAARVAEIEGYQSMFDAAYGTDDVDIARIANALAAYIDADFRAQNTPFDRFLSGDEAALSEQQKRGVALFYGDAGCSGCHSGPLFSDQQYYNIGLPTFGPGMTRRFDPVARDVGRMAVSGDRADAYKFRTPFLRNVANTAPYGHNGAYKTLEGIIRHHGDPEREVRSWTRQSVDLPEIDSAVDDFAFVSDPRIQSQIIDGLSIQPKFISSEDLKALVDFLKSLSPSQPRIPFGRPSSVPSGLSMD